MKNRNLYQERKQQLANLRNRRLTSSERSQVVHDSQTYYYVWGTRGGRKICLGPYNSEDEAWQMIYTKNIQGEPVPLRTRDYGAAKSILKHRSLNNDNTSVDDALQPVYRK